MADPAQGGGAVADRAPAHPAALAHALLHAAAETAARHLEAVPDRPVWQAMPSRLAAELAGAPLPVTGADAAHLLREAERSVLTYPMGNGHPAFFGWVNSAPHPAALAALLVAGAMNPSTAGGDHADVPLERAAVRWLAELVGFPHVPGAGLLTSGASMATIVAAGAARHRALARAGWDVREDGLAGAPRLTAYASAEAHSCVRKAVELLGLGNRALRTVPMRDGRLDPDALAGLVARDRADGFAPFLAVGSAGTVNTGAVDPLDAIAGLCDREGLWFHVDGAYGALGVLDPLIAARYAGMERADSLALDPHKWLQVPAGVGALLVRDRENLRSAFSLVPPYLRDPADDPLGWYSEYGIEQTRPFRALPVWAAIAARGRDGVAADVAACTRAARTLADLVREAPDLELAAPVETSITAFRYAPAGLAPAAADEVNAALPAAVQARGRVFATGTMLAGRPVLRACIINPLTGEEHLRLLVAECRAAAADLAASVGAAHG
jgi:glutamate/tyrosine decarboxylase-like PLP-dependent enzyme